MLMEQASLQAVFTVALTYPAGVTALANTPVAAGPQAVDDGRLTQLHQLTPMMSTYLLAICIGHIVPRSIVTGDCQTELCRCSDPLFPSILCPCSGVSGSSLFVLLYDMILNMNMVT